MAEKRIVPIQDVMRFNPPRYGGKLHLADSTYTLVHEDPTLHDISLEEFDIWLYESLGLEIPNKLRVELGFDSMQWKGIIEKNSEKRYLLGFSQKELQDPTIDNAQGLIEIPFNLLTDSTDVPPSIPSLAFSGVTLDSSGQARCIGIRYFLTEEEKREAVFSVSFSQEELPLPYDPEDRPKINANNSHIPFIKHDISLRNQQRSWKTGGLITKAMTEQAQPQHRFALVFTQYKEGEEVNRFGYRKRVSSEKFDQGWNVNFTAEGLPSWQQSIPRLQTT